MPWNISYLSETNIIQTIYTEPVNLDELKDAALTNIALAKEKQTGLFLADCSSFVLSGNAFDIYELGAFLAQVGLDTNVKEAMLTPENAQNVARDLQFFETVVNNRMINVRIFQDRKAALAWLTG